VFVAISSNETIAWSQSAMTGVPNRGLNRAAAPTKRPSAVIA
jgi:hypothetical protein